ncbi:CheR family methyltransferase [Lichenicola sp.]|uniref:CheR family methyltransferase n=1 Tax=Lichenicola sp. TaxID=2804529 RepID=UPI003B00F2C1
MTSDLTLTDEGAPGTMDAADFDELATFIHRMTGIKMPRSKKSMVEGRLRRRIIATGADDFSSYCSKLHQDGDDGPEVVHLIDAITTNKTDFFREPEHFRILTETVLPSLPMSSRRLKMWSAACSTGAEPYTMAMVVNDFLHGKAGLPPAIVATDICTKVLQVAFAGIYPAEIIAPVPALLRQRYIMRSRDRDAGLVRIIPSLRAAVRFGRLNLMDSSYDVDRDFDVIFCRNVLIYFDRNDQAAVLGRLCSHLRPGGILVLGHSETVHGLDLPVAAIGHTMFRRL